MSPMEFSHRFSDRDLGRPNYENRQTDQQTPDSTGRRPVASGRQGSQLYGVVFGITEEIGLVFHVLWNNNTMRIHPVMDLSARFEVNEKPFVEHPCLGRYFRRLMVDENGRSYFEVNAMCYARYGKLGCMG